MIDDIDAGNQTTDESMGDIPDHPVLHCCVKDEPEKERILTCGGVCECVNEITRNNNTEILDMNLIEYGMVACKKTSFNLMECVNTECIKNEGDIYK